MWFRLLIFILFLPCLAYPLTQTKIVGTGANDASKGVQAWVTPGNITADDASTSLAAGVEEPDSSQFLEGTMSGNVFTIPLSATIDSIKVEIEIQDQVDANQGLDLDVRLLKAGVLSGTNQKKTATIPTAVTIRVYAPVDTVGGDDLGGTWGVALTPADVNKTDFGVSYMTTTTAGGESDPEVDFIRITVSYTAAITATATETIYPEAIANQNTWDSTGSGATKTIRITDGIDANYIRQLTVSNNDRYSMTNLKANDNQVTSYDSLRFYATMQDSGAGTNTVSIDHISQGTAIGGTVRTLTTSWVEYIDGFTAKPGGGAWTKRSIDSLVMQFEPNAIAAGQQVRLSECSVVVFMTLENPPFAYYFNNTNKCTNDKDFAKEMDVLFDNQNYDTLKIDVVDATLTQKNFFTNFRGGTWKTGGFSVEFKVVKSVATPRMKMRISAVNSGTCVIDESTPYTAEISCDSTGDYLLFIDSHDWPATTTGVLQLELNFNNSFEQPIDSLWIVVGAEPLSVLRSSVEVAIPAEDAPSGCANTDSLVPNATTVVTVFDQWETVGGSDKDLITRDQSDATYIKDSVNSQQQKLLLDDVTGTIPADATIDFLQLQFRIFGENTDKVRFLIRLDAGDATNPVNSCQSLSIRVVETSPDVWINETINYLGTPVGPACSGTFTLAGLDSLGVRFIIQRIESAGPAAFHLRVAQIIMFVCYTEAGGAQNFRRRIMILKEELGKIEPVWDGYFTSNIRDGSPTSEVSLVYGFAQPKIWLWRN